MTMQKIGADIVEDDGVSDVAAQPAAQDILDYFMHCYILYCTMPALLCHSVYRSTAQRTVYQHRQELSVIDGRFCRQLR